MSYFDDLLIADLKRKGIVYEALSIEEHEAISNVIQKKSRFVGSQISWKHLSGAKNLNNIKKSEALNIISETLIQLKTKRIIFLGDSAIDHAYYVGTTDIKSAIEIFSEIPQHTYILPEDVSWIACLSAEGYIDCANLS